MTTPRILVVDDDDHVREALVDELSAIYAVDAVASGTEALDALAAQQYDVVISDLKMPDRDGIEVLEFARAHQGDAVRVLLTGYLDDHARSALMAPDAPYKVGKPWHDEIEIVVRRGLEQRERARRLNASVGTALDLVGFDAELVAVKTPLELGQLIVRRALSIEGILACGTVVRAGASEHGFTGGAVPAEGPGWYVDLPLDAEGDHRLRARGLGDAGRQLVEHLAHRAQRACGVLEVRNVPVADLVGTGTQRNQLMRQATMGALTSALLHDLASTVQTLSASLNDLSEHAESRAPELADAVAEATAAGAEAIELFVQMRKLIRDGEVKLQPISADRLVARINRQAGGFVRQKATLRLPKAPGVSVVASEMLLVQVLANLLRVAADASPQGGTVDLEIRTSDRDVVFTVIDDGPGVPADLVETMFDPFSAAVGESGNFGVAIAGYVMALCDGRISYRRHPERGACFSVTIKRA
ncbi:MAG: response regulator [Myxococcales bacterium]|nr:response regulator [Myxococcales bacterium]